MDAVQRERRTAKDYGYLRSNAQIIVSDGPYITIVPVHPAFIPVPYYDPAIVFFPPEPGIVIGGAIRFDFFVTIGEFFRPWGWGYCRFDWDSHVVIINNAPWRRTWINRHEYVHLYESGNTKRKSGFPSGTRCTSALSMSARRRAKDAIAWKSTAITARANLLSGQKVLDALKQATERAKKGKERVGSADTYVHAPLSTAIPIHISI